MTGSAPLARSTVFPSSSLGSLIAQCTRNLSEDDKDIAISALLPSLSGSDSSLSFDEAPPFPTRKPLIFTNVTTEPVLAGNSAKTRWAWTAKGLRAMIAVPTGPRMKAMMLEPICVDRWTDVLQTSAPPNHEAWRQSQSTDEKEILCPPWIPEGSLFPLEVFKAMFRNRPGGLAKEPPTITVNDESAPSSPTVEAPQAISRSGSTNTIDSMKLTMPTIMVSNSTAMVPLSLSSSHSLNMQAAHDHEVSLAARRGKKAPPALTLVLNNLQAHGGNSSLESYPSLSSPFLGSPSSSAPLLQLSPSASAAGAATESMDLQAMCASLRARCPPLSPPISPTTSQSQTPGCRHSVLTADSDTDSNDDKAEVASTDSDEWAFAKELLDEYKQDQHSISASGVSVPNETLVPTSRVTANVPDTTEDDFSWANSATFVNSVDSPSTAGHSTPETSKQQRRKTVIIETPVHPAKLLLAQLQSPTTPDSDLDEHIPLPFESPLSNASTGDSILCMQCRHSTPPPSRPASSASLRPVRGILKGKKTVRFSVIQETREFGPHKTEHECCPPIAPEPLAEEVESKPEFKQDKAAVKALMGAPRHSAVRVSSPLRRSHTPSPTSPTFAQRPSSPPAHLPKHPALRALSQRRSSNSGKGISLKERVTPTLLAEQRRAPVKSLNERQSLPARRASGAVNAEVDAPGAQQARVSREPGAGRASVQGATGSQKRLMKTLSSPPSSAARMVDENAARSDAGVAPAQRASKMPVPFRAVLAKLKQ